MTADFPVDLPRLSVGTWVQFHTGDNLDGENSETLSVYQPTQYFLVIADEHQDDDPGRGTLMDIHGKAYDYCPRTLSLSPNSFTEVTLLNTSVRTVLRTKIESVHGAPKVHAVYQSAKQHIEDNPQHFQQHKLLKV